MLHKSFLPAITSWLSRRNRYIINVYCSTFINYNSPVQQKEVINIIEKKKLIEKTELLKVKKEKKRKEKKFNEQSKLHKQVLDISNYIQEVNPDLTDIIQPINSICKKKNANVLHLIDKDAAAKYVSLIKNDLLKNMCHVIEMNSGFGILTRELLKAGIPLIHLHEENSELLQMQETICAKYPGKLNLISLKDYNFLSSLKLWSFKSINENNQNYFKTVERKNWEDKTYVQIIGALNNEKLFEFIIEDVIFRYNIMTYGRPIFYIAVLPSMWHKFNMQTKNRKKYSWSTLMFQLMFNYEFLGKLNRKAFIPWPIKHRVKAKIKSLFKESLKENYEQIYVVKLEPKADLYSKLSQNDWLIFFYFVKRHIKKSNIRVISTFEKLIPDCGIRLIAKDYTIYTQFEDLTPIQFLELFKEFKSWPEYQNISFK